MLYLAIAPWALRPVLRADTITVHPPHPDVLFAFRNAAAEIYRHPLPIEPTWLRLRWYSSPGTLVGDERVRDMLPLALAPGQALPIRVAPGEYELTLSRAETPNAVLSRQRLNVVPSPDRQ